MNSYIWQTLFIGTLASIAAACTSDPAPRSDWQEASYSYQPGRQEVNDVQRQSFDDMVKREINTIQAKLDFWKKEAKNTTEDEKEEKYEIIAELEELVDEVRGGLIHLQTVGKDEYWDAREDLNGSLEKLREEFREAERRFQS